MKTLYLKPLLYLSALLAIISGAVFINTSINYLFPSGYIQNQKAQVSDALSPALSIYVSTTGLDTNAGTADAPVATIGKALSLIDAQPESGEIIIKGGTYKVPNNIEIRPPTATGLNPSRTILIRAADGETPIFDGGMEVTPTPMEGESGIFLITGSFSSSGLPQVWEENNRVRYDSVADLNTLKSIEYGMVAISSTQIAIHPKGGSLPAQGELRLSTADYGFDITRSNVKVKNLTFKGFGKTYTSAGIKIGFNSETQGQTDGVLVDNCYFENSYSGIFVQRGNKNAEIRYSHFKDVASGINQWGGFATIEHNDIRNDDSSSNLFAFKNPDPMTGATGLFIYYNSSGGRYRYNFIKGFKMGVFIKTVEPGGPFIIEHNTIIDDESLRTINNYGIDFVRYSNYGKENSIVRYNIIHGFNVPINYNSNLTTTGSIIEKNILWSGKSNNISWFKTFLIPFFKDKGMGENVSVDPLFVNPSSGDYRVYANSEAVGLGIDGSPVGAFGKSDNQSPEVVSSPIIESSTTSDFSFTQNPYVRANQYGFVVFSGNSKSAYQYIEYRKKGSSTWIKDFNTVVYRDTYTSPYLDTRHVGEQPLIVTNLDPNTTYEYRFVAYSSYFKPQTSGISEITTSGSPNTFYVSNQGVDSRDAGSKSNPFKTLQYALDMSLPGDDIRLMPGVYFGPFVMFHSGISGHPIIIEADQPGTVALDSRKSYSSVMLISGVSNVVIRNLTFQWALIAGIYCYQCSNVEIANNVFQNSLIGAHSVDGTAIEFSGSDSYIHNNLIKNWWNGARIYVAPRLKFTQNTITNTAQAGLMILNVSNVAGSEFTYNSINFTGNHYLEISFTDSNKGSITIDYNNIGTVFQPQNISFIDDIMKTVTLPHSIFYPYKARELIYFYSKANDNTSGKVYYSLSKWRTDSGFDTHSIFADPLWVDPLNGKFNLKPGSPNLLPGGKYIGAFNTEVVVNNIQDIPPPVTNVSNENIDNNLSPTPTPLRATDGICGTTLNSCTQGILRNTEDSTTQYLWMCLGSNNGFDASCSQNRYIPPVTTNPPTNPVNQPQNPRVNQSTTRSNTPTIYKTGTTPNKDTYTINIPTSTIDITLPKPPSWLDVLKTLLNTIIINTIRGIKRTGEVLGV